jgi:hypothetical protein
MEIQHCVMARRGKVNSLDVEELLAIKFVLTKCYKTLSFKCCTELSVKVLAVFNKMFCFCDLFKDKGVVVHACNPATGAGGKRRVGRQ